VFDYSGKLIMKGRIETGMDNFSLDVSNLSAGIYLIIIRDNDDINYGKFIKAD
jgi:GH43 family beta-xylosidase